MSINYNAILSGALHVGNMGDHALAKAFVNQQKQNFSSITILGKSYPDLVNISDFILPVPAVAIGRNPLRGYFQRKSLARTINAQSLGSKKCYIWLGGVLGVNIYHLKSREAELNWSFNFCNKFVYYFGDVGLGFDNPENQLVVKKIISRFNQEKSWIAVRSEESANLLQKCGLNSDIHIGVDAALYERYGTLKEKLKLNREIIKKKIAIVVCSYRGKFFINVWKSAAKSAVSLGLDVNWIYMVEEEDKQICSDMYSWFKENYPNHPVKIVPPIEAEDVIATASVCVATRYHGNIFAIMSGVPTIGCAYGVKISRLFNLLQIQNWLISPSLDENNIEQENCDFNVHQLIKDALSGNYLPNYNQLDKEIKKHEYALGSLNLFLKS